MSKAYANKRQEYEQKMEIIGQEANAILESVGEPIHSGPSSSLDDVQFPMESDDNINNLTPQIRLLQDKVYEGLVDYGKVQRLIFKRLGDRVWRRPADFISPFQITRSRPNIPIFKVVYLRQKISTEPDLLEYVFLLRFHVATVSKLLFQLFFACSCNLKFMQFISLHFSLF